MTRLPLPDFPDPDVSGRPDVGPSDTSDSANDVPPSQAHTDSDSQSTGERESVEPNLGDDEDGADIMPDRITGEREAGISHAPPNPVKNGG